MKAPKTKDGKQEIVFTHEAACNHDFYMRSLMEARKLWEVMHIFKSDPEKSKKLREKYPAFFQTYNSVQDPEDLFSSISIPHVGWISRDRKLSEDKEDQRVEYEGSRFLPPYIRMDRPYNPHTREESSEPFGQVYIWGDSPHVFLTMLADLGGKTFAEQCFPETPELKEYKYEIFLKTLQMMKCERPSLEQIQEDEELSSNLEDLARFHATASLAKTRRLRRKNYQTKIHFRDWADEGEYLVIANATSELIRKNTCSAEALIREYMREMGMDNGNK